MSRHVSHEDGSLLPADPDGDTLHSRGLYFVCVSIFLGLCGAGCTFAFVPMFRALCANPYRVYLHGLAEGVSGGMYAGSKCSSCLQMCVADTCGRRNCRLVYSAFASIWISQSHGIATAAQSVHNTLLLRRSVLHTVAESDSVSQPPVNETAHDVLFHEKQANMSAATLAVDRVPTTSTSGTPLSLPASKFGSRAVSEIDMLQCLSDPHA